MSHATTEKVQQALQSALAPLELKVQDDSADHAGHAGAAQGSHFSVRIVSEHFKGLSRVARHRLVYDALGSLMTQGIHALALDAKAPGES
jgi:BolA family transcriptional regulator, general stress-responsive regulator